MSQPLQTRLPYDPFAPRPLPGTLPFDMADWPAFDEAFAGQMALRDRLLAERRDSVVAMRQDARAAAQELLELVLRQAYPRAGATAARRDGASVAIDRADPMATLGRLIQDDLCILQKRGAEHVLSAAVLCFPASWTLAEKFDRPLTGIHEPVADYDAGIAARVQRLFDGVRAGRPMWRFNALWYADADLHQPRLMSERRPRPMPGAAPFLRSERQAILRLEHSQAVVFSIHTYVLSRDSVAAQGFATPDT